MAKDYVNWLQIIGHTPGMPNVFRAMTDSVIRSPHIHTHKSRIIRSLAEYWVDSRRFFLVIAQWNLCAKYTNDVNQMETQKIEIEIEFGDNICIP